MKLLSLPVGGVNTLNDRLMYRHFMHASLLRSQALTDATANGAW